jgi:hypothetical protein
MTCSKLRSSLYKDKLYRSNFTLFLLCSIYNQSISLSKILYFVTLLVRSIYDQSSPSPSIPSGDIYLWGTRVYKLLRSLEFHFVPRPANASPFGGRIYNPLWGSESFRPFGDTFL